MIVADGRPTRVLVCGAGFGRIHLRAVSEAEDYQLIGLLSRGSDGSRASAARYGIPCFTSLDQVPRDVDLACVVVPSATGAGEGTEIAVRLLERGVSVLQEAPLLVEEITRTSRAAREGGSRYRVNTLYADLEPVRTFLYAAALARKQQRPLFVDAACGVQVLYSLMDIVARSVGAVRPYAFDAPVIPSPALALLSETPPPYTVLNGIVGGIPVTLRVQNEMDPSDPDNHALLLHRVAIGFEGGVLSLADTHGPVLWNPRLHSTRDEEGKLLLGGLNRLQQKTTVLFGKGETPSFQDLFEKSWPSAVQLALRELSASTLKPQESVDELRRMQWELGVACLWQDVFRSLEPVSLVKRGSPKVMDFSGVMANADN